MSSHPSITILGGGLAGLALGIGLRRRTVPVTVWEAGRYPRHRVCGEFISGRGLEVLERLGLLGPCLESGAVYARTAMLVCGARRSPVHRLPAPALCLSRHVLDNLLAQVFLQSGGELRVGERGPAAAALPGLVRASGRRLVPAGSSPLWFGVKAHVPARCPIALEADLEMHLSPDGYVGLNRIDHGEVNVCGLFLARAESLRPEAKGDWLRGRPGSLLRGRPGSLLRDRLGHTEFDPASFCSVAGLSLAPQRAASRADCCLGDALTLTPPATGNGMSMAMESAELAVDPLADYSLGQLAWPAARDEIGRRCDRAFARRLRWARHLQWMLTTPALQGRLGMTLLRSGWLWRCLFARTRD
jgi:2-polyprenyl-6-methoxyphenol hydroxylase-like FAD-dependent oxidoreductase